MKKLRLVSCFTLSRCQWFSNLSASVLPAPSGRGKRILKTSQDRLRAYALAITALKKRKKWREGIRDSFKVWSCLLKKGQLLFFMPAEMNGESYEFVLPVREEKESKKSQKEKEGRNRKIRRSRNRNAFWRDAKRGQGTHQKIAKKTNFWYDRVRRKSWIFEKLNKLIRLSNRKHSKYSKWIVDQLYDALIEQNAVYLDGKTDLDTLR